MAEGASALASHLGGLSLRGTTFLEYVFLGGSALDLRSKSKVVSRAVSRLADVPWTAIDGSLTGQASPNTSPVVYLKPRCLFRDPFRAREGADAYIILCDTFSPPACLEGGGEGGESPGTSAPAGDWEPHPSNNRAFCEHVMQQAAFLDPWLSAEQQYTLLDAKTRQPLGSEDRQPSLGMGQPWGGGSSASSGEGGYCGLGPALGTARDFAEAHMMACLHAGLKVTGMHPHAAPGRWCYELGVLQGLDLADQLWVSRFILLKLAERYRLAACLEPHLVPATPATPLTAGCPRGSGGEDIGAGLLVRFSTRETREEGCGWRAIQTYVQRLEATHAQHMLVYGTGNTQRMMCPAAASVLGRFTAKVESTCASISVPHSVVLEHKGYLEDRRPAGNCDPYLVSLMLVCTTCAIPLPTHAAPTPRATPAVQPNGWQSPQQRQQSASPQQPAATATSSIGAKPRQQERQEEVLQQRPPPWASAGGGPASSSGVTTASSSAILSELDVRHQAAQQAQQRQVVVAAEHRQQLLQPQSQQQAAVAALWQGLMPDTPDQLVALLGSVEANPEGLLLGGGAGSGSAGR